MIDAVKIGDVVVIEVLAGCLEGSRWSSRKDMLPPKS